MAAAAAASSGLLSSQAYTEGNLVKSTRSLVSDLCRQFYTLGWVSGTGGSITIKVHDDSTPKPQQLIVMSPSGVQKERMLPEDMYVLSAGGAVLSAPSPKPYPNKLPKCTDCAPLFMKAYQMRDAGAVIHSHGMESCLITMINPFSNEFRITHMEMIKGIQGHGYHDELVVPIIENTAHEGELTEALSKAIAPNPNTNSSYDPIFAFNDPNPNPKSSSMPVYDKPVYDDDIFDGIPGMKSSAKDAHNDVFASLSKSQRVEVSGSYDDLLGNFARSSSSREEPKRSDDLLGNFASSSSSREEPTRSKDLGGFDDLIPGFRGNIQPTTLREPPETHQQKASVPSAEPFATMPEDPFVVLETTSAQTYPSTGVFNDPLEHLVKPMNSGSTNFDTATVSGGIFDDINAFDELAKSGPASEKNGTRKDKSPLMSGPYRSQDRSSVDSFDNVVPNTCSDQSFEYRRAAQSQVPNDNPFETKATVNQAPADDVWLSVAEIPLFTHPTSAPPPSRAPPPLVIKSAQYGRTDPRRKDSESYTYPKGPVRRHGVHPLDEFQDFATNKSQSNEHSEVLSTEDDIETNSAAAAAMKDAMDKAEAKLKHAKEVRERERDARSARSREYAQEEKDEDATPESQDWEVKQEKLDHERLQREKEEWEKEQRKHEKEREEREKARQAVDRATREARERAATDARAKAQRAAVEKANAEARQRAERAAVQRAAGEARERASADAVQRAADARERAATEAREKAARDRANEARDRSAVERAAAEARARAERAAVEKVNAEARERAAAAAVKERLNKTENDLESFFGMGARANSAPKQRASTSENLFDTQAQRGSADGARRTPSTSSSTVRKVSSTTSLVDDLTSVFGVPQSSGEFQEVDGESEERRRSRLERHQRTIERAAKALAEKNQRDIQTQMDQAERHKFAETLDADIRRWAAGKEGNLRALLSTLHYVLWPECGWQTVSLTDLITGDKVKRAYRKATLCIHPDKVQQKGATLQQKYIAEKVFDLLKEAWNKFNSEELF